MRAVLTPGGPLRPARELINDVEASMIVRESRPDCPTCGMPMMAAAMETTPLGLVKAIHRCPVCNTEVDRIFKAEEAGNRQTR